MRTTLALLTLTLVAGCRVATAPATLEPDAVQWQAPPHASEWIQRHYAANNRFPELADLTYHVAGKQFVIDARFVSPPAAIGDKWWGYLSIRNGDQTVSGNGVTESLSIAFGNGPVQAYRLSVEGPILTTNPASIRVVGPIVRVACDASLFNFTPTVIRFSGVAHPECNPNGECSIESWDIKALNPHGPLAAVDR
jgi:hypothetical protein